MDDEADRGSEVCFAHLLVDGHPVDPDTARDVARFRRAERARLIAARALSPLARERATIALVAELERVVAPRPGKTVAAYWPIRGEPDLRPWMAMAHEAGARVVLPVVIDENAPLEFRVWTPGCRMSRGLWNILVPAEVEVCTPDIVIAPLVGADEALYRLGNGGGYYDRTLARIDPRPRCIGVGFAGCMMSTIFPMPLDVPMDEILLSDGTQMTR
ncbi:5-formyltetrahydrofolate cyclo-ligase [Salipiger thiooxidans]|uniref:5-formyltetrahydrofolate cyclo-ligase n=1 Tax=Salipiger thiooxidans TaxID=282683 RepID=UPI001A8CADE1|nr:5-formyltetrahydrofolate cyclo-ligase [Salipiger thiooxidans]MBN8189791.1 5-formyltetrahydrofolate cyclo-ligase [Salipiger thiooxidans]